MGPHVLKHKHTAIYIGDFNSHQYTFDFRRKRTFVTADDSYNPIETVRIILFDFAHSQHLPALMKVVLNIPLICSVPRPRWKKAKWPAYYQNLYKTLGWIPPIPKSYERVVCVIISTAKKLISRGYGREYVPGWDQTT